MTKERSPTRPDEGSGGRLPVRPAVNAHVRLTGVVRIGPRYAMLDTDGGGVWRLRSDEDLARFSDQHVTIEARVSASDELHLLWIGADEAGVPD